MKRTTAAILCWAWLLSAGAVAQAETNYYDFGAQESAVWPGFERVTAATVYSATQRFGWRDTAGLSAFDCPHSEPTNHPTGTPLDLSLLWTNPITQDAVVGDRDNVFYARAEPSEYMVYVVCGSSKLFSNQFFDFSVRVGDREERVQIEGGNQFRSLRFKVTVGKEPLAIVFRPRSEKWLVNAVMAWPVADSDKVQKTIIAHV